VSGGRTIAGVSTSVTAFAGTAARGPIDQAVRVVSFGAFEREFGGLAEGSEMSYAVYQFFLNGGTDAIIINTTDPLEGIEALDGVDFNLLCIPGISAPAIVNAAGVYCAKRRAFFIVDAPSGKNKPDEIAAFVAAPELIKTDSAAIYYPWLEIADPLDNGTLRAVAPSGSIAGLYARTDSARGVWTAPTGTEGPLAGVEGTTYLLTNKENGALNPRAINCIRVFPVYGVLAWGARTLRGDDQLASESKYVPVRRLALFIESSVSQGLQWVAVEPNGEALWSEIRLAVGAFMQNLFRQGALRGSTPDEAYFVSCDHSTTTHDDINAGIVNVLIGFAPVMPAEFVIVTIQQIAGQTPPE
jgi:uncharacterized protein